MDVPLEPKFYNGVEEGFLCYTPPSVTAAAGARACRTGSRGNHLCLCAVCRAQMQSCQLLAQLVSEAQGAAGPLTAIQSPLGFGLYRRRQVRAPLSESPPSEEQHDSFESGGRDDYNFLREPESEGSTFYDDDAEPVLLPEQGERYALS
ncbi:hypothetical protein HPB48_003714 [Haemaphysalis longicornis]|uniref:Uncharacterized protein n=1 Tax=Haemaphysalis longicornis TaxID=44386 RepID=A0A9J6FFX1_HAELO|nr:hypothetical protein HPB48_003714 [Haemaphysalis longicornis]